MNVLAHAPEDLLVRPALPVESAPPIVFSTTRLFDPEPGTEWRDSVRRLRTLIEHARLPQPERIVLTKQVHGDRVADACAPPHDTEADEATGGYRVLDCDGLLATEPGVAVVVRTADCLPIVLWQPGTTLLAAVHSGWRGTMVNILGRAVEALSARGGDPARMHAWLGPRIGVDAYEVSEDLLRQFLERWGGRGVFWKGRHLDLAALNRQHARTAGLASASYHDANLCTYDSGGRFPSHRRDGDRRGQVYTVAYFTPGERK